MGKLRAGWNQRIGIATLMLVLTGLSAWSYSGKILDEAGQPLQDVDVCFMVERAAQKCTKTDETGFWFLAEGPFKKIRAWKKDYLPLDLEPKEYKEPLTMKLAATLWLEVKSKDGKDITEGAAFVFLAEGEKLGPFPVNRNGVRIRGLKPDLIEIEIEVPGYRMLNPGQIRLKRGEELRQIVWIEPMNATG